MLPWPRCGRSSTRSSPLADGTDRRGQATVLFADMAGFTALSERLDAELVAGLMNGLWAVVDGAIEQRGGQVDKHIGDAVMGVWGWGGTREDDPERAVRAALDLRDAFQAFASANGLPIEVRIGVNTGPVLFGIVGSSGEERTVTGDAVNVASRVEGLAPHGAVLVAHDTYRHVRGVFDLRPLDPVVVKGKAEPLRTYLVERPKPRAFHLRTRGVEGVETPMLGRDGELEVLQHEFVDATTTRRARVVTIVGEPGAGKSRLLDEFAAWVDLRPETVLYLKGRSVPDLEIVPRGLLRELFAYRFEILDDDPRATVADKLLDGLAPLDARDAHIVGRWLGFDIECDEEVGDLAGSGDFGVIAAVAARPVPPRHAPERAGGAAPRGHPLGRRRLARHHLPPRRAPRRSASPGGRGQPPDARPASTGLGRRAGHFPAYRPPAALRRRRPGSGGRDPAVRRRRPGRPCRPGRNPLRRQPLLHRGAREDPHGGGRRPGGSRTDPGPLTCRGFGPPSSRRRCRACSKPGSTPSQPMSGRPCSTPRSWVAPSGTTPSRPCCRAPGGPTPMTSAPRSTECAGASWCGGTSTRASRTARSTGSSTPSCATPPTRPFSSATEARSTSPPRPGWSGGQVSDTDEHLAPIAEHLALGGEHGRAAVMFERAAKNASATGGLTTACSLYRRALDSLARDRDDHGVAATRIRVELADLLELSGDLSAARLELERAEQDASALGDDTLLAASLFRRARLSINVGDVREAEVLLQRALPLAEVAGGRVLADVLLAQCCLLDVTEQYEAAVEPSRRALDASRAVGDVVLELRARIRVAVTLSDSTASMTPPPTWRLRSHWPGASGTQYARQ